jgi:hypothetical protein
MVSFLILVRFSGRDHPWKTKKQLIFLADVTRAPVYHWKGSLFWRIL